MITTDKPQLVLHYAPGLLWVLKRNPCASDLDRFKRAYAHSPNCCSGTHTKWTTVGAPALLSEKEQAWCLRRSYLTSRPNGETK